MDAPRTVRTAFAIIIERPVSPGAGLGIAAAAPPRFPMTPSRHFALIPAAGVGARTRGPMPKQYVPIGGKPMLAHVLGTFAAAPAIAHVYVVVAPDDPHIDDCLRHCPSASARTTVLRCGGDTRRRSVLNGLTAMPGPVDDDWILVHDAARPGLTVGLIESLAHALAHDEVGGLLAVPAIDTIKQSDDGLRVSRTLPRATLWAAQTPQMFRRALLRRALEAADDVTDEASAIERLGLRPRLVEGSPRNMKVTLPGDFALVEMLMKGIE